MKDEIVLLEPDGTKRIVQGNDANQNRFLWPSALVLTTVLQGVWIGFGIGRMTASSPAHKPESPSTTLTAGGSSVNFVQGVYPTLDDLHKQWTVEDANEQRQQDKDAKKKAAWAHRPLLAPPRDPPPSTIKVGPYRYSVHYTSAKALSSREALALTMMEARQIWLDPERTENLRGDLLHELLHCALDLGTGGGRFQGSWQNVEENEVEGFSDGLLQIVQDNPALMDWLSANSPMR